ncbi:hypothetical protein PNOK_0508100 [Pyrrhoderma noxium]|uniref:Uncharacterized protein n=1 Tax=Pyrrhoderma noxium TaxID=2282107 RepID=A0A286UKL5_9AGAM|nr:hypothetical protein PNOK_0508100 [Pyrrhoderma noxium]
MDENIDSNYEDNVFSHVAAKICGLVSDYLGNEKIGEPVKKCLRGKKIPSREKKAKRSSNKAFKWSNSYKVGEKLPTSLHALYDNDLYPSQIAEETATGRSRSNTPRGATSTKGRSAAILAGPSQRSPLPSPTEWRLPHSVWEDQPPLGDNFRLSSNINEAITTSQGGYLLDPSNDVEQTTLSKPLHPERKESFNPINCYDGYDPSYQSSNNENFFKPIYPHQHNKEQIDSSYPLYIPQDGEFNSMFGIFS